MSLLAPETDEAIRALAARFPRDFAFGAATAAYQIEGAVAEDGRGLSIWDTFSHTPGRVANGDTGDVACDHYHRWRDDLDLMAKLGLRSYRFSVSWPRVLPDGEGAVNERGLDFYDRLVDGLLERGIQPLLTLYHWDLPQALQHRGGWTNPTISDWFAEYAGVVAARLGDRVRDWLTLNEPQVFAFVGHAVGRHAPGVRDWPTALRVAHSALLAHAAARDRIRQVAPGSRIGIALDVNKFEPASTSDADRAAADTLISLSHRWFLDPLFGRPYPDLAVRVHEAAGHLRGLELPDPPAGDLDFLGLNYYRRDRVAADPSIPLSARLVDGVDGGDGVARSALGWEIRPSGLTDVLLQLQREYAPPAVVVTENGAAFDDGVSRASAPIADGPRTEYLARHLAAAADAIDQGVPLNGYHVWSLLDNFEWAEGYRARFGIVHVDYATQRRTLKASGEWYARLLRAAAG